MRKVSISDVLLLALEKAAQGSLLLEDFTYSSQLRALKGLPPRKQDLSLVMAIRRLRTKRFVVTEKSKDGRMMVKLTNVGNEFLRSRKDVEWDGKFRIVVWDIPERKRTIRNLFRRKLKNWGFVIWQKSVWVSKRNVTLQLKDFVRTLEMDKWVAVIESEDLFLENLFKK